MTNKPQRVEAPFTPREVEGPASHPSTSPGKTGPDVPAAHSMDTRWFAVDVEGRVALFDTGEDGALPLKAANLGGPADPNFDTLVYGAALAARGARWTPRTSPPPDEPQRLLVVKPPPALDPALFEEISAGPPWVGLSRQPLRYSKLDGKNEFITVLTENELSELPELDRDGEAIGSLFHFSRDHADEPGLYEGVGEPPAKPLLIDQLPASAREAIGAFRLPIDFTTAKSLHLGDHIKDDEAGYWGDWTLRSFGDPNAPSPKPRAPPKEPNYALVIVIALILAALFLWRVL